MELLKAFQRIIEQDEFLEHVTYIIDPELPNDIAAIKMDYTEAMILIAVNIDDDSLYTFHELPQDLKNAEFKEVSYKTPWKSALNKSLRWVWELKNNQGYLDGIQFEFASDIRNKGTIIQVIGIASRISVRGVSETYEV